jgi:hypothetical protein
VALGWQPARRLATAAVRCKTGGWPIDNRLQLTKLPHIHLRSDSSLFLFYVAHPGLGARECFWSDCYSEV